MVLPNQLTVLRIILTPVFFILFLSDSPETKQISVIVFFIAALTDWYDGWLARKFNYITAWGKFWDPLADKILTSSAFIAFVILNLIPLWMVVLILLRDFTITLLRAVAGYKNIPFQTDNYAKWKTFFQMFFLYYLLIMYVAKYSPNLLNLDPKIFKVLLNENLIFYSALFITIITVHSGALYLKKNKNTIWKLFEK